MSARHRILLVDDNPAYRALMERELQREFSGLQVQHVVDADSLAGALAAGRADAAVIDARTYWSSGLDILLAIKTSQPACAVIMFAADGDAGLAVAAMKEGLDDYLVRPAWPGSLAPLRHALRDCLARAQQRQAAPREVTETDVARKLHLLAEAQRVAHIGSWELDLGSDTLAWSDEHYRILGLEPGAIRPTYERFLRFIHPDDVQFVRDTIAAKVAKQGNYDIECRIIRADGRERHVRSRAEVVSGDDGRPARLMGILQDITEHKQYETALQRSERQLRAALAERRQLSQDLHDNILQAICAVSFSLEHSQRLIAEGQAHSAARELSWEIATLRNIMRDIRHFIRGQEPLLLSASQLKAELAELARMIETRRLGRFSIDVDPAAASQLMPDEARQVLNIAREAMSNSARHAHATCGTVSLRAQDESIRFELRDDGVGFDVQRIAHRGEGLKNIAARARQIGAQIEVLSQPGHGTRVVLDLPLLARGRRNGRDRRRND
ncbi:PAS domain-containing protein [Noviherbaspirillum sp. UKPF54]|uniref:hybrid sensor histidine kinase/response regulator n=1 Tax=Noviherbaspirillum sp. UKPF54 TaxID=2601898 RepID=UPI0011B10888|nr:PAS domain-containing protein [Noviherbaspirillum sp. UKPF54]QDZ29858.1 response regulator [Noviherbaspirillum sp. UKPF54]